MADEDLQTARGPGSPSVSENGTYRLVDPVLDERDLNAAPLLRHEAFTAGARELLDRPVVAPVAEHADDPTVEFITVRRPSNIADGCRGDTS